MMGDHIPVTETRGGEKPEDWQVADAARKMAEETAKAKVAVDALMAAFMAGEPCVDGGE